MARRLPRWMEVREAHLHPPKPAVRYLFQGKLGRIGLPSQAG